MQFEQFGLNQELLKAIQALKYENVLPVQEKVIPQLLNRKDVLVQSKTGSGKTASYAIPEIEKINWLINSPQVLVLTPTRELAKQVQNDFRTLGSYKRINAVALLGKQPIKSQINELKQKVHVVSGTIGRVLDHIERGTLDLSEIKTCIIDEADECLNLGFKEDLDKILNYLPDCTRAMFSATMPQSILELAKSYLKDPVIIKIKENQQYNENITPYYIRVEKENKLDVLFNLIHHHLPKRAIIFCNFRETVENVFDAFLDGGYSCCMIHGGLTQDERLENMRDFKKGMFRFLIASDVAARGIDIANISHIYNYDCPTTAEGFIHRIGRSGRVDNKGEAYTLVLPTQMKYLDLIQDEMDCRFIEVKDVEPKEMDPILSTSEPIVLKEEVLESQKVKLYLKAGKNKKLRAGDIVGAFTQIEGVEPTDIGIIEILDYQSYVEILNNKGDLVLKGMKGHKIKNKDILVEKAK